MFSSVPWVSGPCILPKLSEIYLGMTRPLCGPFSGNPHRLYACPAWAFHGPCAFVPLLVFAFVLMFACAFVFVLLLALLCSRSYLGSCSRLCSCPTSRGQQNQHFWSRGGTGSCQSPCRPYAANGYQNGAPVSDQVGYMREMVLPTLYVQQIEGLVSGKGAFRDYINFG